MNKMLVYYVISEGYEKAVAVTDAATISAYKRAEKIIKALENWDESGEIINNIRETLAAFYWETEPSKHLKHSTARYLEAFGLDLDDALIYFTHDKID